MRKLFNRFYSDYLLPNRIPAFENLNRQALDSGYTFKTTLEIYRDAVLNGCEQKKVFVHRHDIDTDVKTARRFFDSEKKLHIKTSYYFRLGTIDIDLMNEIHDYGSEVGYHYEELAQYCKDFKIKTWEQVIPHLPRIQDQFAENLRRLEARLGFKIKSIASHGDFVNRRLGHSNSELVSEHLKQSCGVELECYEEKFIRQFNVMLSDLYYPAYYRGQTPDDAIKKKINCIYLLSHTRHWHVARWENTKDNLRRLVEGIRYGK